MSKKTIHISEDLHQLIGHYSLEKGDCSMQEAVTELVIEGIKAQKNDLPDYLVSKMQELQNSNKKKGVIKADMKLLKSSKGGVGDLDLSNLSKDVIKLTEKEVEGGNWGNDKITREITLACLKYLKEVEEATREDFLENVYPRYSNEYMEDSFWIIAREGLEQLEEVDLVETPEGRGHSKYIWKGI